MSARAEGARRGWEHRREREQWARDEVEARDPSLLALWEREGSRFKGSPWRRAEAFVEWAESHGGAVQEALSDAAEVEVEAFARGWSGWCEVDLEDEDVTFEDSEEWLDAVA